MMNALLLAAGLVSPALTFPTAVKPRQAAVSPAVASITIVANVTDPSVSRDSCGSALMAGRLLWTCRDTEVYDVSTGQSTLPLITNSASWTDFSGDAYPNIGPGPVGAGSNGTNNILLMYGGDPTSSPAFYPVQQDECPDNGVCSDGSRWVVWENQPPVVTTSTDSSATGYTVIGDAHISGLSQENPESPYALFRVDYTAGSDNNALPTVTLVNEDFWAARQIGFGNYGTMMGADGLVYMYGRTDSTAGTALAKVSADSVEDITAYQYYVDGAWTITMPGINDTAPVIANAGTGGQGTFYYSNDLASYVWIGQAAISVSAGFYLSTAPAPEGPWIEPYLIYQGEDGNEGIDSYSLQAHPGMLNPANQHGIFISWTQQWNTATYGAYTTPLVYLAWQ